MAAIAWLVIAVVLLGTAGFSAVTAAVQLGLIGKEDHLVLTACERVVGGRGGSYIECAGHLASERTGGVHKVRVVADHKPGETLAVARTPWGSYVPTNPDFTTAATAVIVPLFPLAGGIVCGWLGLRGRISWCRSHMPRAGPYASRAGCRCRAGRVCLPRVRDSAAHAPRPGQVVFDGARCAQPKRLILGNFAVVST